MLQCMTLQTVLHRGLVPRKSFVNIYLKPKVTLHFELLNISLLFLI